MASTACKVRVVDGSDGVIVSRGKAQSVLPVVHTKRVAEGLTLLTTAVFEQVQPGGEIFVFGSAAGTYVRVGEDVIILGPELSLDKAAQHLPELFTNLGKPCQMCPQRNAVFSRTGAAKRVLEFLGTTES